MSSRSDKEVRRLSVRWLFNSAFGLLLVGAGMAIFGEAILLKFKEEPFLEWFGLGAISLILFNAGLSFFGTGIKYRIYLERKRKSEFSTRVSR